MVGQTDRRRGLLAGYSPAPACPPPLPLLLMGFEPICQCCSKFGMVEVLPKCCICADFKKVVIKPERKIGRGKRATSCPAWPAGTRGHGRSTGDPWGPVETRGEGEAAGQDRGPGGPGKPLGTNTRRSNTVISQTPKRGAVISFLLAAGELVLLKF